MMQHYTLQCIEKQVSKLKYFSRRFIWASILLEYVITYIFSDEYNVKQKHPIIKVSNIIKFREKMIEITHTYMSVY